MSQLQCFTCGKIYKRKYSLTKHAMSCQQSGNKTQTSIGAAAAIQPFVNQDAPSVGAKIDASVNNLENKIEIGPSETANIEILNLNPVELHKLTDLPKLADYNPNDSPTTQCRNLYKITTQFITETSIRMTKLQENQQKLYHMFKTLEKTAEKSQPRQNSALTVQNLPEKIKQIFANQKNYDKPEITSLDLSPQAILELYNLYGENIIEELIKMIWFNKNIPQNYSIFLINVSTDEVLYYKDVWRKDKFKNIVAALLNFLDNFIGIGFTNYVTVNSTSFSIQAKRAREQFMHVRQSFKNPVTAKNAIPPYIAAYYERIKDLAETMTEEALRGKLM